MLKRRTRLRRNRRNKYRRTCRNNRKGGNGTNVKCCICERIVKKDDTLVPR
jgi:hypothetical protein